MLSGTSYIEGSGGAIEILAGASSGDEVDGPNVYLVGGTSTGRNSAGGNVEVRILKINPTVLTNIHSFL